MNRINKRFNELKQNKQTALIPYITAGDPHPDMTVAIMHQLVASGADLIELGVPFSDPTADGPVIQAAHERALANGVSIKKSIELVKQFREQDQQTPVILMGYLNPILFMGVEAFTQAAQQAGVDGVLIVDCPPDELQPMNQTLRETGLEQIYLVSPTTTDERMTMIADNSGGFVYYVSLAGVTGAASLQAEQVSQHITTLRKHTTLPVCVGFGISNAESAKAMAAIADGVIVGSALIKLIHANSGNGETMESNISGFISELKSAFSS